MSLTVNVRPNPAMGGFDVDGIPPMLLDQLAEALARVFVLLHRPLLVMFAHEFPLPNPNNEVVVGIVTASSLGRRRPGNVLTNALQKVLLSAPATARSL